ncbi:hypothetical protein J2Z79_002507 [Symbiobacterium terraclitae]|uniref:Uncharacterized protein n=1 Tax=Symbiobacterium terraclitae TaxID=557451 RepID=A0ABS4JU98_9FIRM|nr:Wadjet anti-phage system protein JetA family protein [Symbiobacterium terraclitae]MBP2019090.1 hypothetical protein [Symbiobacterium terraclitae]
MELFAVLPERLFSVLASPARAVYAHVLFLIYDLHKQELYGTPREAIIDATAAYLEAEAITEADLEAEDGAALSPRDRAGAILRRLQETGWLEIEQRTDYQQYVNLADYAIAILDTLDRLRRGERTEYSGYVLATYVALTADEAEQNPGLAIGKAYEQTTLLVRDLKSLHQNIKRYTEQLLQQKTPREILAMHFGDYKLEVLDRAYHRLKTTDNVSRFRPRILARIDAWTAEPGWVARAAAEEVRRGRQPSQEAAEEAIRAQLAFIRNSYEQMDDLLDEIDRRNAQYAKASFEYVRYLLSEGEDTEGRLVNLLQHLGAQLNAGTVAADDPCGLDGLFALGAVQTLEATSLFTPRTQRRTHKPQPLVAPALDAAEREAARKRARQRLSAAITYRRIDEYVQARLGDRREMRAADLGVETVDDFVRLIYIAAYGRSRRVGYRVDLTGERITGGGGRFSFRNIKIRRK